MKGVLKKSEYRFVNQTNVYHGKVRDVYTINDSILVMIASDRISAFDFILPKPIPYKGQVINQIASYFLDATKHIVPNWKLFSPDPNVTIGHKAESFPVEMVVRGYLTGHAWREYKTGKRSICGVPMPEGMIENQKFDNPIITPTIKAQVGHDEDISREEIIKQGLVSEKDYIQLEEYTYKLFEEGTRMAAERGLILVDTKYEFGKCNNEIILIDEIHTPDSSRYFYIDGYNEAVNAGTSPRQLSKEFVRQWLIEQGFMGKEGQTVPDMPDSFIEQVSNRYIELYEKITGKVFEKADTENIEQRIKNNIELFLKTIM
ncbi:MAG: phosphoribosylaminoimidazolesuccinocarboxamide synthase [Bacteroidales bacterium]